MGMPEQNAPVPRLFNFLIRHIRRSISILGIGTVNRCIYLILYLFFIVGIVLGQETSVVVPDTNRTKKNVQKTSLEGPISYEAQEIESFLNDRKTVLLGRAKVTYQNMVLKAAKITVEWDSDLMTAEGVWDSVWVKKGESDSVQVPRLFGVPEFSESQDVMTGEVMVYNFRTRKGRVLRGRTAYEDGFYSGQTVKLVRQNMLNVANANFSTCDQQEDPHFHFWSKQMKIEVNKKVIARPIVMYIGRIPVLALPFAFFPIQKERQSGLILPRYGESSIEGRFLKGLGYYWAASQYWDMKGTVDYYERSGFLFRSDLRYAVRYKMQGTISGSWTRRDFDVSGTKERRWDLAVMHSQEISPTMRFTVHGQFVSSGNFYKDISANREQRLQQQIYSNAKLTKSWGTSGIVVVGLNQTRYLNEDRTTEVLPSIDISNRWANLIPKPKAVQGRQEDKKWYHSISMPYSFNIKYERNRERGGSRNDTTISRAGWDHQFQAYRNTKLFGWLTLMPTISYRETWVNEKKEYFLDTKTNTAKDRAVEGFFALRTFSVSLSLNTTVYGLFQPRFLKNVTIRHEVKPIVSFGYQPDFSDLRWGYYQAVEDTQGVIYKKDRFAGALFRFTPAGQQQVLNFGLHNDFKMKIGEGEKERKIDLFYLIFSSSYNWKAQQNRLGNLSTTLSASPAKDIRLNINTSHSFYKTDESGKALNRLYMEDIHWNHFGSIFRTRWARLVAMNASLNLTLKGSSGSKGGKTGQSQKTVKEELTSLASLGNLAGDRLDRIEEEADFTIPWNMTAAFSYIDNRYDPTKPTKSFWANIHLQFNLTKNWKVTYNSRWDLLKKEPVSQDFTFYRDLHCWEASFSWTPTGRYKSFYFRINVKSSMLRDLKFEKGSGRRGMLGPSFQEM